MTKILTIIFLLFFVIGCNNKRQSSGDMKSLLNKINDDGRIADNKFASAQRVVFFDSALRVSKSFSDSVAASVSLANALLETGEEKKCISLLSALLSRSTPHHDIHNTSLKKLLALAWLRYGERINCIYDHNSHSCVFPIRDSGIYRDHRGPTEAIKLYEALLSADPADMESRWLLNIAYMTINQYPGKVPQKFLVPDLEKIEDSSIKPFKDAAGNLRLNTNNQSGGSIVDDFDNDNLPDIVTSSWDLTESMHYYRNTGNGNFENLSFASGLSEITGGLNLVQTDYNNDGYKDIFVLRGAWKGKYGKEPNSLLKNNGDGTFTDVTIESGLLSFYPTQTATWADFNNDGWLDVFIGNEAAGINDYFPCELYLNQKDGTFKEIASAANCNVLAFVKGVTSGDFNNDGRMDIFISTLNGRKFLLKNEGIKNEVPLFADVTLAAGITINSPSFPTWFWDFDNDGWLDIFICSFEYKGSLAPYEAQENSGNTVSKASKMFLYKNKKDGSFENVAVQAGLNTVAFAMGSNFGDIDNDGYPDFYLGTGNPVLSSLVPNKLFRNIAGKSFADVTKSSRVGNLQKGHGVSMADIDNDGDVDIHIEMGGAYAGDSYPNSLYLNPGQNDNHWIKIKLKGNSSNREGIGAKIELEIKEPAGARKIYRQVNSGGSFGANPLTQHIGIGKASRIEKVVVTWPSSKERQEFHNIGPDQLIIITEGDKNFRTYPGGKLAYSR